MDDLMNYYMNLVPFLGEALGKSFEVAVLDCRTESIVAITNNHISGRSVGAPMTDFAKKMVHSKLFRSYRKQQASPLFHIFYQIR